MFFIIRFKHLLRYLLTMATFQLKQGIPSVLRGLISSLSSSKERIVFTNGVFDLLHPGHLFLLREAKDLGDKLIVGIDSDAHVRTLLKRPRRPVNDQNTRKQILEAIRWVDEVRIFDDLEELIKEIRPDILVKGGDYNKDQIIGRRFIESYGGQVVILPYFEDVSTSKLIHKIRGLPII